MIRPYLFFLTTLLGLNCFSQVNLVQDIASAANSSHPEQLIVNATNLFFTAENELGRELWTVNAAGNANLVKDIFLGSASGIQKENPFIVYNNQLFFSANDGVNGNELWVSDGTSNGTKLLKDIYAGRNSSFVQHFTIWKNELYFIASDDSHGVELWKTDGSADGTEMVKDVQTGKRSGAMQIIGANANYLFYVGNNGINGNELWATDGTANGTFEVKDIYVGERTSNISKGVLLNDNLFFRANDGSGFELWKSDGTEAGTLMVKDIQTQTLLGAYPDWLTVFDDALYFTADDGINGTELWKTDGSDAGTQVVADNRSFPFKNKPRHLTVFNEALYFSYNNGINGRELWKTDGTLVGTVLVKDIASGLVNSDPTALYPFGNLLFFSAKNITKGVELWASDGTEAGTELFADINEGDLDAFPENLISFNGLLYFAATTAEYGRELFRIGDVVSSTIPNEILNQIRLFPNPANHFIQIDNPLAVELTNLTIFSAGGQLMLQQKFGTIIDIKALPSGAYTLQLTDAAQRIGWLNFIKQ